MKLEKAIETLEDLTETTAWPCGQVEIDAISLGIEALKQVLARRPLPSSLCYLPLPGETKD